MSADLLAADIVEALVAVGGAYLEERRRYEQKHAGELIPLIPFQQLCALPSRDRALCLDLAKDPYLFSLRLALRRLGELAHKLGDEDQMLAIASEADDRTDGRLIAVIDRVWDGVGHWYA